MLNSVIHQYDAMENYGIIAKSDSKKTADKKSVQSEQNFDNILQKFENNEQAKDIIPVVQQKIESKETKKSKNKSPEKNIKTSIKSEKNINSENSKTLLSLLAKNNSKIVLNRNVSSLQQNTKTKSSDKELSINKLDAQIKMQLLNKLSDGKAEKLNIKTLKIKNQSNKAEDKTIENSAKFDTTAKQNNVNKSEIKNVKVITENSLSSNLEIIDSVEAKRAAVNQKPAPNVGKNEINVKIEGKQSEKIVEIAGSSKENKDDRKLLNINKNKGLSKSEKNDNISRLNNSETNNNTNQEKSSVGKQVQNQPDMKITDLKQENSNTNELMSGLESTKTSKKLTNDKSMTNGSIKSLTPDEFVKETVNSVKNLPANSKYSARILLKPESLGTLFVKMELVNGVVKLKIEAESKETMKIIENQIFALKDGIARQGLKMENIDLELRDKELDYKDNNFAQQERKKKENKFNKDFISSFKDIENKI